VGPEHCRMRARCCRSKKARTSSVWDAPEATPALGGRWDATPGQPDEFGATPGRGPEGTPAGGSSRWDATPTPGRAGPEGPTPRRNRWDDATPTPGRVRRGPSLNKVYDCSVGLFRLSCVMAGITSWQFGWLRQQ
jgi:hypothetical protein